MNLEAIKSAIVADTENTWATQKGWGPVYTAHQDAKILIIGQAPGIRAQTTGIPWNDPSGDNLRNWMGIDRATFYDETNIALVPMDFYFPGSGKRGDLPPRKGFAERWHPVILHHMPQIQMTILIGQYAHAHYLRERKKGTLTETVRHFHAYLPSYFPLVHPSPRNIMWQKKNPWFVTDVLPTLKEMVQKSLIT